MVATVCWLRAESHSDDKIAFPYGDTVKEGANNCRKFLSDELYGY